MLVQFSKKLGIITSELVDSVEFEQCTNMVPPRKWGEETPMVDTLPNT